MVITTNTKLDRNLWNCPHDGIIVGADNIRLDLNGHTVDGVVAYGSAGVRVGGHTGVIVKGRGTLRQFSAGVVVGASDATVRVLGDRVTGVTITANQIGIFVGTGTSSRFDNNTVVTNSGPGVVLSWLGANFNSVSANTIRSNHGAGVAVGDSFFLVHGNVVAANTVTSNQGYGIFVGGAGLSSLVWGNTVFSNSSDGIDVFGSGSSVRNDLAIFNSGHGIVAGSGVTDAGGNNAYWNHTPPQCVNVKCPGFQFILP